MFNIELVKIPAGTFMMGSPESEKARCDDEAQVSETLTKPFELGKHQVTQAQWKSVMGTEPWKGQQVIPVYNDPATFVSYYNAVEFCAALTEIERDYEILSADEEYRLPTEAEWEYACRAGTTTAFSFGDDESKLSEYAWFSNNTVGEDYPHKVGFKKPNPWGLYDMHGNVSEWCSDWYDGKLIGGVDPIGPMGGSFRVRRGGSLWSFQGDCRSAFRDYRDPSDEGTYIGFRVVFSS